MRYAIALLIKFIMSTALLSIVLGGFYGISFANILTVSILLTGTSFIIGDLYVLPRFENISAAVVDFGLSFIGVWLLGYLLFIQPINLGVAAFISALFIAFGEVFFHMYMDKQILKNETNQNYDKLSQHQKVQTEFSKEFDTKNNNNRK